jgi:pyruvate formate lyase activating enzyme
MFKSVVWSSTIDYPEQVSTVLFVGTCNWKCKFCHNYNLINNDTLDFQKDILPKLLSRKEFINYVVISGGECTLYPELINVIKKLKENGLIIGIHTNGSNSIILKEVIPLINFIGMDIKTSKNKYNKIVNSKINYEDIIQSLKLIIESGIKYDFRTTVYPEYVNLNDCIEIATLLYQLNAKEYVLQQYDNRFIDTNIKPYSLKYLKEVKKRCNEILPTILRGI